MTTPATSDDIQALLRRIKALEQTISRLQARDPGAGITDPTFNSLNVGAAVGAGTGEIAASGRIRANSASGSHSEYQSTAVANLANNATAVIPIDTNASGLLVVVNNANGAVALLNIEGARATVVEISDPTNKFSTAPGTAGMHNIYFSAGIPTVENKTGGTDSLYLTFIGYGF